MKDENSFLFTLANPTGARPTKVVQCSGIGGVWQNSLYGPSFGSATGASLIVMNNNNSASYCDIDDSFGGFQFPEGYTFSNFFCGSTSFRMDYLEVFALKETL